MTATVRRWSALFAVAVVALAVRPGSSDDKPSPGKAADARPVADRLAERVDVEPFDGKFAAAVRLLRERYGLPLVLDPSLDEPGEEPAADRPVRLPKLTGVRTDTLLGLVGGQAGAVALADPDVIRLVRSTHGLIETGVYRLDSDDPQVPPMESPLPMNLRPIYQPAIKRALVNAGFKARPVAEVVDAIAEATGANLVLAPAAGEAAKLAVTVRFANTPVEVAVRTLAELADLGVIEDGPVLILTSRERADARAAADAARRHARALAVGVPAAGLGGPDVATELARLREQADQMRKQLDELAKPAKK